MSLCGDLNSKAPKNPELRARALVNYLNTSRRLGPFTVIPALTRAAKARAELYEKDGIKKKTENDLQGS